MIIYAVHELFLLADFNGELLTHVLFCLFLLATCNTAIIRINVLRLNHSNTVFFDYKSIKYEYKKNILLLIVTDY